MDLKSLAAAVFKCPAYKLEFTGRQCATRFCAATACEEADEDAASGEFWCAYCPAGADRAVLLLPHEQWAPLMDAVDRCEACGGVRASPAHTPSACARLRAARKNDFAGMFREGPLEELPDTPLAHAVAQMVKNPLEQAALYAELQAEDRMNRRVRPADKVERSVELAAQIAHAPRAERNMVFRRHLRDCPEDAAESTVPPAPPEEEIPPPAPVEAPVAKFIAGREIIDEEIPSCKRCARRPAATRTSTRYGTALGDYCHTCFNNAGARAMRTTGKTSRAELNAIELLRALQIPFEGPAETPSVPVPSPLPADTADSAQSRDYCHDASTGPEGARTPVVIDASEGDDCTVIMLALPAKVAAALDTAVETGLWADDRAGTIYQMMLVALRAERPILTASRK